MDGGEAAFVVACALTPFAIVIATLVYSLVRKER